MDGPTPDEIACRVFVGGLNYATTDDGLQQAFEAAGLTTTKVQVLFDRDGKSKGYGFVTLTDPRAAQEAIRVVSCSARAGGSGGD